MKIVVENANKYILLKQYNSTYKTARRTDVNELEALLGLVYILVANKSNHQNAFDLFRTNGMSMEIYQLTMALEKIRFLLRNLRFDDKTTREKRQKREKLAVIREFLGMFTAQLPKQYTCSILQQYTKCC